MADSKSRILYFLTETAIVPESAGLLTILKKMDASSYRLLLASEEGEYADWLRANSIEFDTLIVPVLGKHGGRTSIQAVARFAFEILKYYRKLIRYFKMYSFEVVHSFGFKANLLSVGFKILFNVCLVWQFSEMLHSKIKLRITADS